ncbi:MAG: NAD-dependent epimerase/dehydratase family protein [Chloroflexota bacterium]
MNILLLGGTIFLGRHLVEAALTRGHNVTLFNRGQHNADWFSDVEKLRGDRDGDLAALQGRRWDAVIDTCGYAPRIVRASAELLANAVEHYTFVSSISVYARLNQPGLDENTAVGQLEDQTVEEITGETYGPLKALCEQTVADVMPGRSLNIRPGLIVGPYDPLDRFTYWVTRVARGGEVLAPGRPARPVQIIDARDLAEWNIRLVEQQQTGTYNTTGPDYRLTMQQMLDTCKAVTNSDASLTWADDAFLIETNVGPWGEMPLWVPENHEDSSSILDVSIEQALAAGLTFRPLTETMQDTLEWSTTRPANHEWRAGMRAERETEILQHWHQHSNT